MRLPLDSILYPSRIQLLKIDVEGMEPLVLAGAVNLLRSDRPIVYFEVLEIETLIRCRDILTKLGYEMYWVESSAYNERNFVGNSNNIWGEGETAVLAVPTEAAEVISGFTKVTGSETAVPKSAYRRY
ncbi:hypothetical protein BC360_30140 [Ensifer sp. LC163]|nr:hypothetical protein BC360_30140 [Ensifer sp. LC163]